MFLNIQLNGSVRNIEITEGKTNILSGNYSQAVQYAIEHLLRHDFSHLYDECAKIDYNFDVSRVGSSIVLKLGYSSIVSENGVVTTDGGFPAVHMVRYMENGGVRSCLISENSESISSVFQNMCKYSDVLTQVGWMRLVSLVNHVVGGNFVELINKTLRFNDVDMARKVVYLVLSECMTTPPGYRRLVILPDLIELPEDMRVRLLSVLDDMESFLATISLTPLKSSAVEFLGATEIHV